MASNQRERVRCQPTCGCRLRAGSAGPEAVIDPAEALRVLVEVVEDLVASRRRELRSALVQAERLEDPEGLRAVRRDLQRLGHAWKRIIALCDRLRRDQAAGTAEKR